MTRRKFKLQLILNIYRRFLYQIGREKRGRKTLVFNARIFLTPHIRQERVKHNLEKDFTTSKKKRDH